MSRVLITSWLQGSGGIETHFLRLSRLLVEHGAEVTVAARVAKRGVPLEAAAADMPIQFLKTPFARSPRWLRLSTAWAAIAWPLQLGGKFDVLLTTEMSRYTSAMRRFLKPNGRVIGVWAGELPRVAASDRVRFVDTLMVETELHRNAFQRLGREKLPIGVAPLLGNLSNAPPRRALSHSVLRIAYVGRYTEAKGIFRLLDYWPKLNVAPAELHFFGRGEDEQRLRQAVLHHPCRDQITVHEGWSRPDELTAILSNLDLVVLPSTHPEGLPAVLLEAMAHGVPFVATDIGAVRTLAEDNPDLIVLPLDDAALIAAINRMATAIRVGTVRPERLQHYFESRYSFQRISSIWLSAVLDPQTFWGNRTSRT